MTIWNPLSGDRGKSFDFGVGRVMSVAYSPDGLLLAVGGTRGVVVIDVD
ncbi:hypothetical protein J0H58_17135 [bacterium]|nr:hypothetical protein [bacterium]